MLSSWKRNRHRRDSLVFQDHFSHDHVFVCWVPSFTDWCIIIVACYLRFVDFAYVGTCMRTTIYVRRYSSSRRRRIEEEKEQQQEEERINRKGVLLPDIKKKWSSLVFQHILLRSGTDKIWVKTWNVVRRWRLWEGRCVIWHLFFSGVQHFLKNTDCSRGVARGVPGVPVTPPPL